MSTLKSHSRTPESPETVFEKRKAAIEARGDLPYATVEYQLDMLKQLLAFEFGRFLLANQGVNGYWTDYMLTHQWHRDRKLCEMEDFILNRVPILLATQERFLIFLKENQMCVKEGAKLGCIPSGMMGELLYLDYAGVNDIELLGIDYDPDVFQHAESLARTKALSQHIKLTQADAWQMNLENELDLLSSNGLNIYEESDEKVTELYQSFYKALKPGGKLVASFLTHPPMNPDQSEWVMTEVNQADALKQKILFSDVVSFKFQHYRSSETTRMQLESAGFSHIQFIYDKARIFPTVTAIK